MYSRVGDHGRPHGRAGWSPRSKPGALLSSCQSSCGSVTSPSFFPAAGPQGGARWVPAIGQDAGGKETTHTRAREASLSLPSPKSEPHLATSLPSHHGGGRGNTSGTERRPRRAGGGRVSGEEKSRSVASHHRSRRVRGITRSWLDVVADASSPLICRRSSGERDACVSVCHGRRRRP